MDYFRSVLSLEDWWIGFCEEHHIPLKVSQDEIAEIDFSLIPDDLQDKRIVEIDEPFILEFTDGQQIELEANDVNNEVIVALNEIPANAKADINTNNIDGNVIFSSCLGRTITAVKFLPETPREPYVPVVVFVLDNHTEIQIEGRLDYCNVSHNKTGGGKAGSILPISWGELKKGLHNP